MVAFNRPDVLNTALKKIVALRYPVSDGPEWSDEDTKSWRYFSQDFGIKSGEANHPEFGYLPPLLQLWVGSLTPEIEENGEKYGLSKVVESKNHPNPGNYLPNVGGFPDVTSDADGNPVFRKLDKDGNPQAVSPADQVKLRQVLGNTVPSSANALQTEGLTDMEQENPKQEEGNPHALDDNGNPINAPAQQAGVEQTPQQAQILPNSGRTPEEARQNAAENETNDGDTTKDGNTSGVEGDSVGTDADGKTTLVSNSQPGGVRRPPVNEQSKGGSTRVRTN